MGFVSDFEFRISNLKKQGDSLKTITLLFIFLVLRLFFCLSKRVSVF